MKIRCLWLIATVAHMVSAPLLAQTVFDVAVQEGGAEVGAGVAVLVAGGAGASATLLTSDEVIGAGESAQYVLLDATTGARILGQVETLSEEVGLALLSVPGLRGTPTVLASEPSGEGRRLEVLLPGGRSKKGHLHSVVERAGKPFYRFSVRPEPGEKGAPVMNNCGELLTISRVPATGGWGWVGFAFGVGRELEVVKSFLAEQDVAVEIAPADCLSVEERLAAAEAERAALEERQAELEEAASAAKEKAEELAEIEAEKSRLESQLGEQQEELDKRQQEAAEKEEAQTDWEESQRRQDLLLRYGGAAAIALLVGGGASAWLLLRARRRRLEASSRQLAAAEEELARTKVDFPDLILTGHGPDCGEVRLKVNGKAVARSPGGQVLGRSSARADYVLGARSVSRRHVRFKVANGELLVEDLSSLNGTRVDGASLKHGSAVQVREGSTLALGDVRLVASFLEDSREGP